MTYDDLAMTLLEALGLSDQPVTELTLNFRANSTPHLSVTLEIADTDADITLRGFHESLRQFELRPIDAHDEEEQ